MYYFSHLYILGYIISIIISATVGSLVYQLAGKTDLSLGIGAGITIILAITGCWLSDKYLQQ